jgi:cytochrome c oxidase cbb3-type subunit 2
MPSYPWLEKRVVSGAHIQAKMKVMRTLGIPYTDEEIANAAEETNGKTEMEALIGYLQSLGTALGDKRS